MVSGFDDRTGRGVVTADDGTELAFHAVAIADGSRTIEVGSGVEFEVVPGLLGRWEAARIRPAARPAPPPPP